MDRRPTTGSRPIGVLRPSSFVFRQARRKARPLHRLRHRQPEQIAQRRVDVDEINERVAPLPCRDARSGHQQRHVDAVLVEALLAHQPVAAKRQAVVACEYNNRVVKLPGLSQRGQHAADLRVEMRNHTIIGGQMPTDLAWIARIRGKQFVAHLHLAVVERMLRPEVVAQRQALGIVHLQVLAAAWCGDRVAP